jgi:hypothetical protein
MATEEFARYDMLTAVLLKIQVFWVVTVLLGAQFYVLAHQHTR